MSKQNILLLDDEEMILNSTSTLLELLGYKVYKATTSEEAIDITKKNNINIAILDIFIPNSLSGIECNKILKKINKNLYSIIVSGDSMHKIFDTYKEYEFDAALSKPYSLNKIKKLLDNIK